jgi:Glycosyl transferase family 2/SEC-C motif
MPGNARYAFITPYYKEDRSFLERCIASVRAQSIPADQLVIADGFPQAWVDAAGVRHLKLDGSHGDFGNTARAVGAMIAIGEEYDGIGFLDADNWLESDHVEACVAAARASPTPCDYVIARRTLRRPDETILPRNIDPSSIDIDTNCFFFLRGAFSAIPTWGLMPKVLSPVGDQYFFAMMRRRPYVYARTARPTVNFHCLYEACYREAGETPPPGSKSVDYGKVERWLHSLDQRELEIARRLTGLPLVAPQPSTGSGNMEAQRTADWGRIPRNSNCPCGSGKKFKYCHGAIASGTQAVSQ